MKKILVLMFLLVGVLFSQSVIKGATPYYSDYYDFTKVENVTYSLDIGKQSINNDYHSTKMITLNGNYLGKKSLSLNNTDFTYILFYNNNNGYLGYYKTDKSTYVNAKFLGNVVQPDPVLPYTINLPETAVKFVIVANLVGNANETLISEVQFYSLVGTYRVSTVIDNVNTPVGTFEDMITNTGLGKLGLVLFSLIVMGLISFLAVKVKASLGIIFLINGLLFILFTFLGWFPLWSLIVFTLGLVLLIFVRKGGGD